jgi:Tol biopolymer transport system component
MTRQAVGPMVVMGSVLIAACGGSNGRDVLQSSQAAVTRDTTRSSDVAVDELAGVVTTPESATTRGTESVAATTTAPSDPTNVSGEGVGDPTGRIAFGRIMAGHERNDQLMALYAIDPDGTDLVQLTDGDSAFPAWSPDGSRLAFTIVDSDQAWQIATIAADGSDLQLLTSGAGVHEAPSWSPDGSWIAYDYSPIPPHGPGFHTVLYRMDADGSNQEPLGDPDANDYEPKISPDGRSVLFQRWTGTEEPVMIRDLVTGQERTVLSAGGHNASWSPDGEAIVVQTDPSTAGWIWGPIVRIDVSGAETEATELYPGGGESGGFKPVYSPDGSHIAFGCGHDAGTPDYDEAICVMNADGNDVRILVDSPGEWDNEVAWGVTNS